MNSWFDGSKVVDNHGNPKRMYHGTRVGDIKSFDPSKSNESALYGPGLYFTDNPEVAGGTKGEHDEERIHNNATWNMAGYAFQGRTFEISQLTKKQMTYAWRLLNTNEALADARSDIGSRQARNDGLRAHNESEESFRKWLSSENSGYLGKVIRNKLKTERVRTTTPTVYPVYLSIKHPFDMNETYAMSYLKTLWDAYSDTPNDELDMEISFHKENVITGEEAWKWLAKTIKNKTETNNVLKKLGYDGIHHEGGNNVGTFGKHDVWIAFYPNQVKSVFASKYDSSSDQLSESTLPLNKNVKKVDPALLTFSEYRDLVDPKHKWHPDNAYDVDLKSLNKFGSKPSKYPHLLKQTTIHGLKFVFKAKAEKLAYNKTDENGHLIRIDGNAVAYTDDEILKSGLNQYEYELAVFNDKNQKVAAVQDEWGTLLIMVAQEYRGFGLGPLLVNIARSLEPARESGGFTSAGFNNFTKVYREFVRDALTSGYYHSLIKSGQLTIERVKEIVSSAQLENKPKTDQKDFSSSSPSNWALYEEYGCFVLYDKKLKDYISDEHNGYFAERMIVGMCSAVFPEHHPNKALVNVLGGNTTKIGSFLLKGLIDYCTKENVTLYIEEEDLKYVDDLIILGPLDKSIGGYKRYSISLREPFDLTSMVLTEKKWRKSFDKYQEFFHAMIEMAHAKFQ